MKRGEGVSQRVEERNNVELPPALFSALSQKTIESASP
jgi:hypothetical protein